MFISHSKTLPFWLILSEEITFIPSICGNWAVSVSLCSLKYRHERTTQGDRVPGEDLNSPAKEGRPNLRLISNFRLVCSLHLLKRSSFLLYILSTSFVHPCTRHLWSQSGALVICVMVIYFELHADSFNFRYHKVHASSTEGILSSH